MPYTSVSGGIETGIGRTLEHVLVRCRTEPAPVRDPLIGVAGWAMASDADPADATGWRDPAQVDEYVSRISVLAPRLAGEEVLVDALPPEPRRVLDLGCGDGRLAARVLEARLRSRRWSASTPRRRCSPSPATRFADRLACRHPRRRPPGSDRRAGSVRRDRVGLRHPPPAGRPDKRRLFGEMAGAAPTRRPVRQPRGGGLSHAGAPPHVPRRHREGGPTIPEDQLADVESQLTWMRDAGLEPGRLPVALAGVRAARRGRLIPTRNRPPNGPNAPSGWGPLALVHRPDAAYEGR